MVDYKDIPVLKTFVDCGKYYVYDFAKNTILCVSAEQYVEICNLSSLGISAFQAQNKSTKAYRDIISLIKKGFFVGTTVDQVVHPYNEMYEALCDRFIQDLVLEVTQDCNFQCRYCLYANHTNVERDHFKRNMSLMTAKSCVDFLYEHSKDAQTIRIGFYGGEPFLNFELIKFIVEYANNKFQSKNIIYITTTNGSILNDEHIDFIIRNKFELLISNDGPYQDKHRRFRVNGNETSDIVNSLIKKIFKRNSTYFMDNVNVGPVLMPDEDDNLVYEHFNKLDIPKEKVFLHSASLQGIDYIESYSDDTMDRERFINSKLYIDFLKKLKSHESVPKNWCHDGQCVIGVKRLFATVDGDLYPCEKIVGNEAFCIGNINTSPVLNMMKSKELLNIAKLTENECKQCWAFRFCNMCIARCIDIDKKCVSAYYKRKYCEITKQELVKCFKVYVETT